MLRPITASEPNNTCPSTWKRRRANCQCGTTPGARACSYGQIPRMTYSRASRSELLALIQLWVARTVAVPAASSPLASAIDTYPPSSDFLPDNTRLATRAHLPTCTAMIPSSASSLPVLYQFPPRGIGTNPWVPPIQSVSPPVCISSSDETYNSHGSRLYVCLRFEHTAWPDPRDSRHRESCCSIILTEAACEGIAGLVYENHSGKCGYGVNIAGRDKTDHRSLANVAPDMQGVRIAVEHTQCSNRKPRIILEHPYKPSPRWKNSAHKQTIPNRARVPTAN